jgi:hypothetical protein
MTHGRATPAADARALSNFLLHTRDDILCRSVEGSAHNPRLRGWKIKIRVASPTPGAATRFKNIGGLR